MQKGLGIAALVVAIISIFVPFAGTWMTILAASLAAFAYGEGIGLGIASIAINIVHIFFFSPLLWITQGAMEIASLGATASGADADAPFIPWILIAFQVAAAAILFHFHKKGSGVQSSGIQS